MKRALIIGSEGQDGTLLKILLKNKGYKVFATGRKRRHSAEADDCDFLQFDLTHDSFEGLAEHVKQHQFDEIYYVAAFHISSQEDYGKDTVNIDISDRVNYLSFVKVLEVCRNHSPSTRIAYTSSSLIFAGSSDKVQTESSVRAPRCIYSLHKCSSMDAAKYYRDTYDLFVSVGIMYNHESTLRESKFLSQIVIEEARKYAAGETNHIVVGNLSAQTDWGYAPDYVEALWHMLQLKSADDFIVASGRAHSVQSWFEVLLNLPDTDLKRVVSEDKSRIFRNKPLLIGNPGKLEATGWTRKTSFEQMVTNMYHGVI